MPENVEQQSPNESQSGGGTSPAPKPEGQQLTPNPDTSQQRPGAGQPSGDDARVRGMLADLQRERVARQAAETRYRQYEGQLEQERRRVQALAGVSPRSAEELEDEAIRDAFGKKFPHLAKLTPEQVDRLIENSNQSGQFQQATELAWTKHNHGLIRQISEIVSEHLGGGALTQRQRDFISRSYAAKAEMNPDFLARHEAGDETLVEEFAKEFLEDWIGPVKRTVTSTEVNRNRPVPSGRGRGTTPVQQRKKIDFNNPKEVEDAMVESYRGHGGDFGVR